MSRCPGLRGARGPLQTGTGAAGGRVLSSDRAGDARLPRVPLNDHLARVPSRYVTHTSTKLLKQLKKKYIHIVQIPKSLKMSMMRTSGSPDCDHKAPRCGVQPLPPGQPMSLTLPLRVQRHSTRGEAHTCVFLCAQICVFYSREFAVLPRMLVNHRHRFAPCFFHSTHNVSWRRFSNKAAFCTRCHFTAVAQVARG